MPETSYLLITFTSGGRIRDRTVRTFCFFAQSAAPAMNKTGVRSHTSESPSTLIGNACRWGASCVSVVALLRFSSNSSAVSFITRVVLLVWSCQVWSGLYTMAGEGCVRSFQSPLPAAKEWLLLYYDRTTPLFSNFAKEWKSHTYLRLGQGSWGSSPRSRSYHQLIFTMGWVT